MMDAAPAPGITAGPQPRAQAPMPAAPMPEGAAPAGRFGERKQASPEQQRQKDRLVEAAVTLWTDPRMRGDGTRPGPLLELLAGGGDPVEGLASATVAIVTRVATAAEQAGQQIDGDALFNAGIEIFQALADISDAASIPDEAGIEPFAENADAREGAFFRALDQFRVMMQDAGRIDPEPYRRDLAMMQGMDEAGELEGAFMDLAENDPRERGEAAPTGREAMPAAAPGFGRA